MLKLGKPIGLFGGTFDPIHNGHLRSGVELMQALDLQEIRFIPCHNPLLDKETHTSPEHRLRMLQIAIGHNKEFVIDERELKRNAPSYTIDTLLSIRQELPEAPLCLIIGFDSLSNLNRWRRWTEIIELCHIIVMARPGYSLPTYGPITSLMERHQIHDPDLLSRQSKGYLYLPTLSHLPISSTAIRQQISLGLNPQYLLPEAVLEYILQEKLYSLT